MAPILISLQNVLFFTRSYWKYYCCRIKQSELNSKGSYSSAFPNLFHKNGGLRVLACQKNVDMSWNQWSTTVNSRFERCQALLCCYIFLIILYHTIVSIAYVFLLSLIENLAAISAAKRQATLCPTRRWSHCWSGSMGEVGHCGRWRMVALGPRANYWWPYQLHHFFFKNEAA